jgi:hypothetical protein
MTLAWIRSAAFAAALTVTTASLAVESSAADRAEVEDLEIWLFAGDEEFYRVGDRILRYPVGASLDILFSSLLGPDPMAAPAARKRLAAALRTLAQMRPAAATVDLQAMYVRGLVQEAEEPRADIRLLLARPELRASGVRPAAGYEAIYEAAQDIGCMTMHAVPYEERHPTQETPVWRLVGADVRIDARLPPERFEDCLFRSLLIALGLHHTERLAFDPAPLTPAERAEALAVLALVYHPRVESGMTREEFLAVLRAEGLVAE